MIGSRSLSRRTGGEPERGPPTTISPDWVSAAAGPSIESVPDGVGTSAPAGLDLELGQDVGNMRTNRSRADEECHRDFSIRMTGHQQAQYLALARRQPRDSAIIVLTLRGRRDQPIRGTLGLHHGVLHRYRPPRCPGRSKALLAQPGTRPGKRALP